MMYKNREDQKNELIRKREDKEMSLQLAADEKERQNLIRKEIELIKREDKLDNVERIARANEHQQRKVLAKIEQDKMRSETLQQQKADLLAQRFKVRR